MGVWIKTDIIRWHYKPFDQSQHPNFCQKMKEIFFSTLNTDATSICNKDIYLFTH